MRALDPRLFLEDPDVHSLVLHQRADLVAADVDTAGSGAFVIFAEPVPKGQIYVVKTVVPYAQERTNVGLPDATYQMIAPQAGNTFFSFEPAVDTGSPFMIKSNVNAPQTAAAPINNDRQQTNGITFISSDPWSDAQRSMLNPLFTIVARANKVIRVVFRIIPPGVTNPIVGYSVGGTTANTKRVDFAGVVMAGVQMSEQTYDGIMQRLDLQTGVA